MNTTRPDYYFFFEQACRGVAKTKIFFFNHTLFKKKYMYWKLCNHRNLYISASGYQVKFIRGVGAHTHTHIFKMAQAEVSAFLEKIEDEVPPKSLFNVFIVPQKENGKKWGYVSPQDSTIKKRLAIVGDTSCNIYMTHNT